MALQSGGELSPDHYLSDQGSPNVGPGQDCPGELAESLPGREVGVGQLAPPPTRPAAAAAWRAGGNSCLPERSLGNALY